MGIKLIVGLGNPGKTYEWTRHNAGFHVLDLLEKEPLEAGELFRPGTFMNTSGTPVAARASKKGLEPSEILVVCDDFAIPMGRLRIRKGGSSGGHNGLDSILSALQTQDVPRLRIGIGPVPEGEDPAKFVLERFRSSEKAALEESLARAAEAVRVAVRDGVETAMNLYNSPQKKGDA